MANVPKPLSEKDLAEVEMLAGLGMRYEDIALTKGVCVETLKKYAGDMLERGKAKAKAQVMQSAFKMALSGKHPAMTMFWLKTQCGWREKGVEQPVTVNIQSNHKPVESVTQQLTEALQQVSQGQLEPKVVQYRHPVQCPFKSDPAGGDGTTVIHIGDGDSSRKGIDVS